MAIIEGTTSGNKQEVDSNNNALVNLPGYKSDGTIRGGGNNNGSALLLEMDSGSITGERYVLAPKSDTEYRLKIALDNLVDDETFNYTAQNTGKHQLQNTTQTITFSAAGLLTNASGITTTTTGCSYRTYAMYQLFGKSQIFYFRCGASFSNTPVANCTIDFGLFHQPTSNPFVPTDGIYFRLNSTGLNGVINNNTTEVESLLNFTIVENIVYDFEIVQSDTNVLFYIDRVLYAKIEVPVSQGSPYLSTALPFGIRQAHVGAAGGVIQMLMKSYSIFTGGSTFAESKGERSNGIYGSYQGLSGGVMGSLSSYTNNTNPTAAVPSNTALTANLPAGLGGQAWETFTLALNTDGILMSYQVPAGTVAVQGRRLKITGVKLSSFVQTVLAGGPMVRTFTLNFGHTAVSLATGEAATTKARRVVLLPELTQTITANQAVSTMIGQSHEVASFSEPIYVNPGEFVSLSVKHIGTVGTSGTIATNIQYVYSWE